MRRLIWSKSGRAHRPTASVSTPWALCVDESSPLPPLPSGEDDAAGSTALSEYGRRLREQVQRLPYRVVSLIMLQSERLHFDGDPDGLALGRLNVVATLPAYRRRKGLTDGLVAMCHARSRQRGDAGCLVTGIPGYCGSTRPVDVIPRRICP